MGEVLPKQLHEEGVFTCRVKYCSVRVKPFLLQNVLTGFPGEMQLWIIFFYSVTQINNHLDEN